MTAVRYTPGALPVAVAPQGIVVLGAGTSPERLVAAWEQLHAGNGMGGVIDVLAEGGSLSALPGFTIVVDEGDTWRVAVRGTVGVVVDAGETIDGAGASTWSERSIPGAATLTIGGEATGAILPLRDGLVGADALVLTRATEGSVAAAHPSAIPAEPVQPHSVAEVRDVPAAPAPAAAPASATSAPAPASAPPSRRRAASAEETVTGITDSLPEHLRPPARTDPAQRRSIPGLAPAAPAPPSGPAPISFVPGASATPIAPVAPSTPPAAAPSRVSLPAPVTGETVVPPAPPLPSTGVDDDVEATVMRDTGEPAAPVIVGDHDGETVSLAEARAMRAGGALPAPAPAPAAPPPPPARAPGRLRFPTGQLVLLDRPVVIGRRPRSTRVSGTGLPHLVAVDSPQQDISRNHVEVRPEGDSILATDLNTTNGTTLLRAGAEPVRLHPGEATMLVPGDVLDLGDDVRVTVEPAP